jgi:hypothetical protein
MARPREVESETGPSGPAVRSKPVGPFVGEAIPRSYVEDRIRIEARGTQQAKDRHAALADQDGWHLPGSAPPGRFDERLEARGVEEPDFGEVDLDGRGGNAVQAFQRTAQICGCDQIDVAGEMDQSTAVAQHKIDPVRLPT